MLVSLPRYAPFHDCHKKTLAFSHRNEPLDNFIKPRSILKHLMWLVEIVNSNKQLSIFKRKSVLSAGFQCLKPNCNFSELQIQIGHGSHGNKGTILFLGSVNVPMSVISTKLYFVEIS